MRACRCTCTGCRTARICGSTFLARSGGLAPDLPGFGRSGKPGSLRYTIDEYADFVEAFLLLTETERVKLVVHDWGAVALAFAQRHPERIERLVVIDAVPFLPGYRWHRTARIWRTPVLGELAMGSLTRSTLRLLSRESNATPGPMPQAWQESVLEHFDQGTQRAILRLYRSSPPDTLAAAGVGLRELRVPSLVVWGLRDPYIPQRFAREYADALGGAELLELARRGALAVARPAGDDRPGGGVPRRRAGVSTTAPEPAGASAASAWRAVPPAWALTAAFGLLYVIVAPYSSDLAAAGYRSDLFARAGLTLWDNGWYGGHHLLAYSLLAPALGALLGTQLLAALAATAACALFPLLAGAHCTPRATRIAALWFALGTAVGLLANRVAFDLGLALGIGALVLASRGARTGRRGGQARMRTAALALAALCALASPVAGAFLALAALAWALGAGGGGRFGWALAASALLPIALLEIAFPEGGSQPFVASAFWPALAAVLVIALAIPSRERVMRAGTLLYALALLGAYAIPTAVGGNADRLGALVAGPLLVCALAGMTCSGVSADGRAAAASSSQPGRVRKRSWRGWALLAMAPLLLYWQLRAPLVDYAAAVSDRAASRSYYAPLLAELRSLGVGYGARPARIEVVPTRIHSEAVWVAERVMLARGWERQLDVQRDGLFYDSARTLSATRYRAWLGAQAVSYVALPDAALDYSGRAEARLVRSRPPYLREVWSSRHWRLFAVVGAGALAQPPGELVRLDSDSFTLRASRAGAFTVRVRFTPYWALTSGRGCVARAAGGWTSVRARAGGELHVAIEFSLARVFAHGARCR